MKKQIIFLLVLVSILTLFIPRLYSEDNSKNNPEKIRLGLVTGTNIVRVVGQWNDLKKYIESSLGIPVEIVLRDNYIDLLHSMQNGEVDVIEGSSFLYTELSEKANADVLVGEIREVKKGVGSRNYRSYVIALKNSDIDSLKDLEGMRFSFTDPQSTTGYLYPRTLLADAGITDPENFFGSTIFSRHHDVAINAVLNGTVDAAGVGSFFVDNLDPETQKSLKVIAKSEPIPIGPLSYRKDLPKELVEKLRSDLLKFHLGFNEDQLQRMNIKKFVPADDAEYDPVRKRYKQLEGLPKVDNSIQYKTAPLEFDKAISAYTNKGVVLITAPITALVILLIVLALIFRKTISSRLNVKMVFAFVSISVIVLAIFTTSTVVELQEKIKNKTNEYLWDLDSFETGCTNAIVEERSDLLAMYTDDFARRPNIIYAKIISGGKYVTDSSHRDEGNNVSENILNKVFYVGDGLETSMVEVLDPIAVGNRNWGLVQVGISLDQIGSIIKQTFIKNLMAIFASIILSVLVAYLLARKITNPLKCLMSSIRGLKQGADLPVEVAGSDEISALASSFEEMRIDLKDKEYLLSSKMEELDDHNIQLKEIYKEKEKVEPPIRKELNGLVDKLTEIETRNPKLKELRETIILGDSPEFSRTVRDIFVRSRDNDPVLIYGETGSGKTGVARSIHQLSERSDKKFGEFNCAEFASADAMIVLGKLFGYGKDCGIQGIPKEGLPGLLEEYDGATLFLDEVTSLPLQAQALLLLPLEGRSFNPAAGKGRPNSSSVRFIFAANLPLLREVEGGRFRKDLLRRMKVRGTINIPPLRDRKSDIPVMAEHFLKLWSEEMNRSMKISAEAMAAMRSHDYHNFNIGELISTIRVAADNASFDDKKVIDVSHLPPEIQIRSANGAKDLSWADEIEKMEVLVLRDNNFVIIDSEKALGYQKSTKTLTNHIRGICYKALYLNDWSVEATAKHIVGESSPISGIERFSNKVRQYLDALKQNIIDGTEQRLFNNLPQKYHQYINEAKSHNFE